MSDNPQHRTRRLAAAIFAATALLMTAGASPAWADDDASATTAAPAPYCWADTESQVTTCYPSEEQLDAAIVARTGSAAIEQGSELARSRAIVSPLAVYTIARLYEDASYGGSFITVTAGSSTICASSSVSVPSMPSGWNDRVSSFRSYYSCTTRAYENASYGGASLSGTNVSSMSTMNDKTSSYRVS